jgi:hypothetical protein
MSRSQNVQDSDEESEEEPPEAPPTTLIPITMPRIDDGSPSISGRTKSKVNQPTNNTGPVADRGGFKNHTASNILNMGGMAKTGIADGDVAEENPALAAFAEKTLYADNLDDQDALPDGIFKAMAIRAFCTIGKLRRAKQKQKKTDKETKALERSEKLKRKSNMNNKVAETTTNDKTERASSIKSSATSNNRSRNSSTQAETTGKPCLADYMISTDEDGTSTPIQQVRRRSVSGVTHLTSGFTAEAGSLASPSSQFSPSSPSSPSSPGLRNRRGSADRNAEELRLRQEAKDRLVNKKNTNASDNKSVSNMSAARALSEFDDDSDSEIRVKSGRSRRMSAEVNRKTMNELGGEDGDDVNLEALQKTLSMRTRRTSGGDASTPLAGQHFSLVS